MSTKNGPEKAPAPAASCAGARAPDQVTISAIVPARNEALNITACVRSLAQQPEIAEIIVVNDQSSDGTAGALAALGKEIACLRVIDTKELPAGWVGKSYAAWRGAQEARGEWLLFTDADVTHLENSARQALADAERTGAALVSYSPDQELRTWGERALVPFVFVRLSKRYSYGAISNMDWPDAAANGQYLMIERKAYEAIGGHAAVRADVLEDVALARRMKRAGRRIYFARGEEIAQTRMYRSFGELWRGWKKNLYPLLGGSTRGVAVELVGAAGLVALAFCLLLIWALGLWMGRFVWLLLAVGVGLIVLEHLKYAGESRGNRYPLSCIKYFLPAALFYAGLVLHSAAAHRMGDVEWKGRRVPVAPVEIR